MIDILFISLYFSILILHDGICHCLFINPAVCRNSSAIAGSAHQRNIFFLQNAVYGGQHTGVIAGTEINAYGVIAGGFYFLHITFQTPDIFHRHGIHFFQNIGSSRNSILERHNSHTVFHYSGIITHSNTANTWHSGIKLLQFTHMGFKLFIIGHQHYQLGILQAPNRFLQIAFLAHTKKLFQYFIPLFRNIPLSYPIQDRRSIIIL